MITSRVFKLTSRVFKLTSRVLTSRVSDAMLGTSTNAARGTGSTALQGESLSRAQLLAP